jgi:PhnB protein
MSPSNNCIPSIAVNDAKTMIEFYKTAFDAVVVNQLIDPENGTIGYSEIMINDGMFHLSEESKQYNIAPKSIGGVTTVKISITVNDVDAAFTKAIDAGAVEVRPPKTEFYGYRSATIKDPADHLWLLQKDIEGITYHEMQRRWNEMVQKELPIASTNNDNGDNGDAQN